MTAGVLASDFSTEPYWADGLKPFSSPSPSSGSGSDVAIIGAGFAGLSAAFTLARGGRSVTIFEARRIGDGAAARAAGSLSHVPKATLGDLERLYGAATAQAVYREAREAREYVEALIRECRIECGLRSGWRFVAAHSPRAFAKQVASLDALRETWGGVELVERGRQREVIGSDAFFGGVKIPNSATLQPALLQHGLAYAAVSAGALLLQDTRVVDIRRKAGAVEIVTERGRFTSTHVILATNAETGAGPSAFRSMSRRLIPVPAYALATEEVPPDLLKRVLPINGPVSDTYKIINYIAPDHTGRRFIISARAGRSDGSLRTKAERMLRYFTDRFPELRGVRITHCWTGLFAVTGDWIPHAGVEDGVHYVLGCCGTGIPMATYLGHRVARKILEMDTAPSVFERPLPKLSLKAVRALLLPMAVRGYALRDRLFH